MNFLFQHKKAAKSVTTTAKQWLLLSDTQKIADSMAANHHLTGTYNKRALITITQKQIKLLK